MQSWHSWIPTAKNSKIWCYMCHSLRSMSKQKAKSIDQFLSSSNILQIFSPLKVSWSQTLFLLPLNYIEEILVDPSIGLSVFWFDQGKHQPYFFPMNSNLEHNYCRHLLCLISFALDCTAIWTSQSWLHQEQKAQDLHRQLGVCTCLADWVNKKFQEFHVCFQIYQAELTHLAVYRVLSRTIPSKHYRLEYLLDQREWK